MFSLEYGSWRWAPSELLNRARDLIYRVRDGWRSCPTYANQLLRLIDTGIDRLHRIGAIILRLAQCLRAMRAAICTWKSLSLCKQWEIMIASIWANYRSVVYETEAFLLHGLLVFRDAHFLRGNHEGVVDPTLLISHCTTFLFAHI